MRKITFFLILVSTLMIGCNKSDFTLSLTSEQILTLDKIQEKFNAQKIEVYQATDIISNNKIKNSISINIFNSKIVDIQSPDLNKFCEDILVEFISASLPNYKFDFIEILFFKGFDIKIFYNWDSNGVTFSKQIIESAIEQLNSPRYKLEQVYINCEQNNCYDSLIIVANKILNKNSDVFEAFKFRGYAYLKQTEYDKAEKDFIQARKLNNKDIDVPMNLAILYGDIKNYTKGLSYIDSVFSIQTDYPKAYYFSGIYKLKLGDKESGIVDLEKADQLGVSEASSYLLMENER